MKKFRFLMGGEEIKEPTGEELEVLKIAIQYPHSKEVVQDVYDVVKDFEKTKAILDMSCKKSISVYPILDLIKQGR